jgi:DNA-binding SARP family transcriptional activator
VLKDGEPIRDWESAAARTLSFLFVSYPEGLRRDRVIDMMWPGANQSRGNSRFHSTMYRLRSALSKEIIVHENGIYRINPNYPYRYDVFEFEQLAKISHMDKSETGHLARARALGIYQSSFLESCESTWCHEIREALEMEMLDLLLAHGEHLVQQGQFAEAESCFLRGLALDSFDERAHRGIMLCRALCQDRTGAIQQYHECERILAKELDVEPGKETVSLYASITMGKPISLPQ